MVDLYAPATQPPDWKYQRQFDHGEGVRSARRRVPDIERRAPVPLDDAQIAEFLANGCLLLKTGLPAWFHEAMFERFVELVGEDNDRNPGNNLLPLMPELDEIFEDAVVKGALVSVLGEGYMMHPHRVLHDNPPGSREQVFHHDSYWGYKRKVHNHHPYWVMIMYYPQKIYPEIGPTGVVPGSHCIAQRLDRIDQIEIPAVGQAGTCMLIHYDIWHRKMRNATNHKRFMLKFEFMRMEPPRRAGWNNRSSAWAAPARTPHYVIDPMWREHWSWISGRQGEGRPAIPADGVLAALLEGLAAEDPADRRKAVADIAAFGAGASAAIPHLIARLDDISEPVGLAAAYALAGMGEAATGPLVAAMLSNDGESVDDARVFIDEGQHSEVEMTARNAAHGLVALGSAAVPALLAAFEAAGPRVRKYIAFALGEIIDDRPEVLGLLARASRDADVYVRINAVEGLGLKQPAPVAVDALTLALADGEDEVRFNAAFALARLGPGAAPATAALTHALGDGNRYVSGYAVEALRRIGTPEAMAALVPFLITARWCPTTTNKSLF
jgi:HEAT repeat protein